MKFFDAMNENSIDMKLARSRKFWNIEETDRPLLSVSIGEIEANMPFFSEDIDDLFKKWEYYIQKLYSEKWPYDDTFPAVYPWSIFGHALMPGIVGCKTSYKAGTWWAEHVLDNLDDMDALNFSLNGHIFDRISRYYDHFIPLAQKGIYPAAYPILGPVDLASCIRGSENLCIDLYENKEGLIELLKRCTDFCVKFAEYTVEKSYIPELSGMVSSAVNIWYPRNTINTADDNSILFSPAMLDSIFTKYEKRLFGQFNGVLFEIHSGSLHTYPIWFNMDEISVIKITIDPIDNGHFLDVLHRFTPVAGRKCLLVNSPYEFVEDVIRIFGSKGLAINTACNTKNEAAILLEM